MSLNVNNGAADSENYVQRDTHTRSVDTSHGLRALMSGSITAEAPESVEGDRPGSVPVMTEAMIQENYRRVRDSAKNTIRTIHPDGKVSYKHDIVVRDSDGIQDTTTHGQRTDRGEGTTDSLSLLSKEGASVKVEGLLDRRGADGRFKKGGK